MQEIQKEQQFTTLFVSHDLAVIDLLSDRIAMMQHGVVVEQGERGQILGAASTVFTKKLISSVQVADPEVQKGRKLKP